MQLKTRASSFFVSHQYEQVQTYYYTNILTRDREMLLWRDWATTRFKVVRCETNENG